MDMTNKKPTRDILKEVLTKEHDSDVNDLDELAKLILSHTMRQHPQEIERLKEIKSRQQKGVKKKTTYYLSEDVFEDLSSARNTIENLLPDNISKNISKSGIVDTALKLILKEWSEKGINSDFFKEILKDHNDK